MTEVFDDKDGKIEFVPAVKTLRDEFAMAALTGLMSDKAWFDTAKREWGAREDDEATGLANGLLSVRAYSMADAMLKAREATDD